MADGAVERDRLRSEAAWHTWLSQNNIAQAALPTFKGWYRHELYDIREVDATDFLGWIELQRMACVSNLFHCFNWHETINLFFHLQTLHQAGLVHGDVTTTKCATVTRWEVASNRVIYKHVSVVLPTCTVWAIWKEDTFSSRVAGKPRHRSSSLHLHHLYEELGLGKPRIPRHSKLPHSAHPLFHSNAARLFLRMRRRIVRGFTYKTVLRITATTKVLPRLLSL